MIGEIMESVSLFQYLGSFFSEGWGLREDIKVKVNDEIKMFVAI